MAVPSSRIVTTVDANSSTPATAHFVNFLIKATPFRMHIAVAG